MATRPRSRAAPPTLTDHLNRLAAFLDQQGKFEVPIRLTAKQLEEARAIPRCGDPPHWGAHPLWLERSWSTFEVSHEHRANTPPSH
jgi:hypothetical protein